MVAIDRFFWKVYIFLANGSRNPMFESNARFETSAFADNLEWYPPLVSA